MNAEVEEIRPPHARYFKSSTVKKCAIFNLIDSAKSNAWLADKLSLSILSATSLIRSPTPPDWQSESTKYILFYFMKTSYEILLSNFSCPCLNWVI